jgi:PST family polysaccharide transporter
MENGGFLAISTVKIGFIIAEAPLMAFVWAIFVESLIVAFGLMGIYAWRGGKLTAWRFRFARAKILLKDSWPLILSGLAIMVYMRIDQLMLGQMLGDESVGIYSAAVRISEVWYFIPMAIAASVFPSIIETKKQDETIYYQRLQKLYDMMVMLALSLALLMTFLSDWVVILLFGTAYQKSGPVLAVHIWAGIFVFLGVASGKWFLIEGLQRYTFYKTLLGAVVNVGLNFLMIPKFGATGAAYATVISYAIAAMFSDLLQKETRPMFRMKLRAFNILRIAISIRR